MTSTRQICKALCLLPLLISCKGPEPPTPQGGDTPAPAARKQADTKPASYSYAHTYLDQNWDASMRDLYWYTPQGAQILPYDWFLVLEQPASTEKFRTDANLDRLRFIIGKKSDLNKDGLPIGFTRDVDEDGKAWLGFNCAACHTGQVDYKGKRMLIEGGAGLTDFAGFEKELNEALIQTYEDDARFARFATALGTSEADRPALRKALMAQTEELVNRARMNHSDVAYGPARVDAFGQILNQVNAYDLGIPDNARPADAPVSYPFVWDTPQANFVQWPGSNINAGLGAWIRNAGEVLGVYGVINLDPEANPPGKGYTSSVRIANLTNIEKWITQLQSPLWPEEHLPKIDQAKAAAGKAHYEKLCTDCHTPIDRTQKDRKVTSILTPVTEVKTDPKVLQNIGGYTVQTGKLAGQPSYYLPIPNVPKEAQTIKAENESGVTVLANAVIGTIVNKPESVGDVGAEFGKYLQANMARAAQYPDKKVPAGYKARPLNGIWATAPYLHNGSVPNMWQLLQSESKRVKTFHVGSRELDPVNVGYVSAPGDGTFELDTSLPGNHNVGHSGEEYGTELTDDEKWELIEYIKTL